MARLRSFIEAHRRAVPLALAALALAMHAQFFVAAGDAHQRWDSSQYLETARNLVAGRGFTLDGRIEARRTPGYPAFLIPFAAVGFRSAVIAAVQHLLAVGLVVAIFYGTTALTGDLLAGAIAAFLLAIDSGQIYMANMVMTETLMSVILVAIVFVLARFSRSRSAALAALAGLLVALGVLVRPVAMYLWLPLAAWIVLSVPARRAAVLAAFLACAASLPLLWMWRNDVRAGTASLSSIAGEDLYYWRAAGAVAMHRSGFQYSPLPFSGEEEFRRQFFRVTQHEFVETATRALDARFGARAAMLSEVQVSEFEGTMARDIFRRYPGSLVLLTINGALHLVFDSTWMYADTLWGGTIRIVAITLMVVSAVVCFILAITGFVALRRVNAPVAWLLATMLLYFVAVSSGPEHEQWRYRVPLIPLEMILVAANVVGRPKTDLR